MAKKRIEKEIEQGIGQGEKDIQYLMDYAAKLGIQKIYQDFPIFRGAEKLLLKHMDWEKLRTKSEEIYSGLIKNNIRGERARDYIEKKLADYVESAEFFDQKGKEIVVEKGVNFEPNSWDKFVSFFKPKSEGEKELNNTMNTLHDLYLLYKSKRYEKSIPELKEPFQKVEKYLSRLEGSDFVPAAANIFESYGTADKREMDSWRREYSKNFEKKVKEGKEHIKEVKSGLEGYLSKVAASIFGICGLGMILSNFVITGAVIDAASKMTNNIVGGILIIVSMLMISRMYSKTLKE